VAQYGLKDSSLTYEALGKELYQQEAKQNGHFDPNLSLRAPISVVIPAHNVEDFIQEAIESVHAQTLPVTELIVIADDCSDETQKIAERVGATVLLSKARNIAAARNLGIRSATQEWIALLDADDLWEANKLELQWKALKRFPEAAIISCELFTVWDGGVYRPSKKQIRQKLSNVACPMVVTKQGTYFPKVNGSVLTRSPVPPPTALIRRDVFAAAGFFDEDLLSNEDVEFFARALKCHSLAVVEEPLVCRRLRKGSNSTHVKEKWTSYISIVDRMLQSPDKYAPHAGEEHRKLLKRQFVSQERLLVEKRES
jgi:glycosyltransferase involved in cell wall biosynthesis